MMDDAVIYGNGMVGNATGEALGIKKRFDTNADRSNCTLNDVASCRYVFICLPTPVKNGDYETSHILEAIRMIEEIRHRAIFIIRSTVWPGFADHVFDELRPEAVISNPEFLSESTWEKDAKHPPFILIGGFEGRFRDEVKALYTPKMKSAEIILTDNKTAETAKLAMNAFFSTKVIFANQLYDYCQKSGSNYEKIKEVLDKHQLGLHGHNEIWYKEGRGVRGHCLPKDLDAFASLSHLPLLEKVREINDSTVEGRSIN